jgi:hypothetical protein
VTAANVGNFFAEGSGQIDLMILFLHEDLANLFRHGIFSERFTLLDAIAVIADVFVFTLEIVVEHVFRIFRRAHWLGRDGQHFAQVVDLPRDDQGMIELLLAVDLQLCRDAHVLGAAEDLGINNVFKNGLIFARKIFV